MAAAPALQAHSITQPQQEIVLFSAHQITEIAMSQPSLEGMCRIVIEAELAGPHGLNKKIL